MLLGRGRRGRLVRRRCRGLRILLGKGRQDDGTCSKKTEEKLLVMQKQL